MTEQWKNIKSKTYQNTNKNLVYDKNVSVPLGNMDYSIHGDYLRKDRVEFRLMTCNKVNFGWTKFKDKKETIRIPYKTMGNLKRHVGGGKDLLKCNIDLRSQKEKLY
jgi:hypothetical protein